MMKEEFESRLGGPVSDAEYRDIEYVYQFYPTIDTKDQIVDLYKIGGMRNPMNSWEKSDTLQRRKRHEHTIQRKKKDRCESPS